VTHLETVPNAKRVSPVHVVWDWNGTLVDDVAVTVDAVNVVLTRFGVAPIDAEGYRTHYRRPVSLFYEELLGRRITAGEWIDIDDLYHGHYHSRLATIPLASGAASTLASLTDVGHGQSLLSMWRHEHLLAEVVRHGIDRHFRLVDGLVGPGGGGKVDHLRTHLERLAVEAAGVLVVGDALDDADAARALGARALLVASGTHHRADLEGHGTPVVDVLSEVLAFV